MALLMLAVLPVFVIGMVKLFVAKRRNGLGLACCITRHVNSATRILRDLTD